MDIYCQKCGEAFSLDRLSANPLYQLRNLDKNFLDGDGCPRCNWGKGTLYEPLPAERPVRAEMMQILREQYGDDLDTIASELADMFNMGLLEDENNETIH